jgi:predicted DNA-binding transcriptional regulator AlpA
MYAAHSGWIQSEIEAAKEFSIPIIAVLPRGNERFPEAATHAAVEQVAWYRSSIIGAVQRRARPMFPTIGSANPSRKQNSWPKMNRAAQSDNSQLPRRRLSSTSIRKFEPTKLVSKNRA